MSKKTFIISTCVGEIPIIMEDGRVRIADPGVYSSLVEMFSHMTVQEYERPPDIIRSLKKNGIDIGTISDSCRRETAVMKLKHVVDWGLYGDGDDILGESVRSAWKEQFFNDPYPYLSRKNTGKITKDVLKTVWNRVSGPLDISRERFIGVSGKNLRAILSRVFTFDDPEVLEGELTEMYANYIWEAYADFAEQEYKKAINAEFDRIILGNKERRATIGPTETAA